jgi:hypothetical protein
MIIPRSHNRVTLLSAQIPKTYYLITESNRRFSIGSTDYLIDIGNYTTSQLISHLNVKAAPNVFGYSDRTAKISLTTVQLSITVSSQRLRKVFGLTSAVTSIVSSPQEFPNVACMAATGQIWICTNLVQNEGDIAIGNALSHFFCNALSTLSFIVYDNSAPNESSKALGFIPGGDGDVTVDATFCILDDNEERVDLNGLGMDFVLRTWYQGPDLYPLVQSLGQAWSKVVSEDRALRQSVPNY